MLTHNDLGLNLPLVETQFYKWRSIQSKYIMVWSILKAADLNKDKSIYIMPYT
jgi:hypothetical protein